MTGELEGIGDVVTGGLAARAVEPEAGEGAGHTHETNCLNCGAALQGSFCHVCGQKAHVHRTLSAFWHDILHSVFHFEGKIWRTLPLLAWRPGLLTRRYIDGERATFVSPIALFLFSAFLMFGVAGMTGALSGAGSPQRSVEKEKIEAQAQIKQLEQKRAAAIVERRSTERIDDELVEAKTELAILERIKVGSAAVEVDARDAPAFLQGWIDKAATNPDLLFYKLKTNAYKFSWALIPISVPFVWLLFPRSRRFTLYDHTVFVTYSLCFMMLLLIVSSTIGLIIPLIGALAWLVPPWHMYRHLKQTYGLRRAGALWRTALLIGFAFASVALFMTIIAGFGGFD